MFLVGLTGSAIPYLLFLGVVIVLTLGTNTEVLNKKCMPQPKSDMHLTYADQTTEQEQVQSFNFKYTEHHFFQKKTIEEPDSFGITENPSPTLNTVERKSYAFFSIHYTSTVYFNYFGLSPPVMA